MRLPSIEDSSNCSFDTSILASFFTPMGSGHETGDNSTAILQYDIFVLNAAAAFSTDGRLLSVYFYLLSFISLCLFQCFLI